MSLASIMLQCAQQAAWSCVACSADRPIVAACPPGVWLLRNSAWSAKFLDTWWSMDGFIRRKPGDTKSGDNDALKVLLGSMSR